MAFGFWRLFGAFDDLVQNGDIWMTQLIMTFQLSHHGLTFVRECVAVRTAIILLRDEGL